MTGARADNIPELVVPATTTSRKEDEIAAALITGITNAIPGSLNRLAELEARLPCGFRTR